MRILFVLALMAYLIAGYAQVCFAKGEPEAIRGLLSVSTGQFQPTGGRAVRVDFSLYSKGSIALLQELDGTEVDIRTTLGKVTSVTEWKPVGSREIYLSVRPDRIVAISRLDSANGQFYVEVPGKSGLFKLNLFGQLLNHDDIAEFIKSRKVTVEGTISDDGSTVNLIQLTNRTSNKTLCELELHG